MPPVDSDLLHLLATLPANVVYTFAPKESVIRGFDYYRRGRLEGYAWSPDRSTLTAYVRGTRLYAVACAADADVLTFSCDCPAWMPEWQCKHVVCAFLTTANLLSPTAFAFPGSARIPHDKLRENLLADRPARGPSPEQKPLRRASRSLSTLGPPTRCSRSERTASRSIFPRRRPRRTRGAPHQQRVCVWIAVGCLAGVLEESWSRLSPRPGDDPGIRPAHLGPGRSSPGQHTPACGGRSRGSPRRVSRQWGGARAHSPCPGTCGRPGRQDAHPHQGPGDEGLDPVSRVAPVLS